MVVRGNCLGFTVFSIDEFMDLATVLERGFY